MNAEERNLIAGLFDRLRGVETAYRDPEADAFIADQVARQPHAPYAMAQTLIVQNQSMEAAQTRIAELEQQLEAARRAPADDRSAPSPWGPRASEAMGAPAGFGAGGGAFGGRPTQQPSYGQQPYGQQDSYREQPYAPQSYGAPVSQPSRGGGFLSGALTTAAGVAGGALLFSGIQSMFGGGEAHAAGHEAAKAADVQPDATPDAGAAADASGADSGGGWFSGLLGGSPEAADAGAADQGADDAGGDASDTDDWI